MAVCTDLRFGNAFPTNFVSLRSCKATSQGSCRQQLSTPRKAGKFCDIRSILLPLCVASPGLSM
jgi:hypothetical protein